MFWRWSKPQVKAGTGILVIKDGRVLAGIRKGSHGAGILAFPGGHIDFEDESLPASCAREIREEVGIEVKFRQIRGGWDLFSSFDILDNTGAKRYLTTYLVADYVSGGEWLDDLTLKGKEPHKCERWQFHLLEELRGSLWIPTERIELNREVLGI